MTLSDAIRRAQEREAEADMRYLRSKRPEDWKAAEKASAYTLALLQERVL